MPVTVTQEESIQYLRFVDQTLTDFNLKANENPPLWHYTSGAGIIGIVKTKTLWASQVSCLNDASELRYSYWLLRQAFIALLPQIAAGGADHYVCTRMIEGLTADPARTSPWFVACLSECHDDLNQWRGYGGGENGYALVFNSAQLRALTYGQQVFLGKVNYHYPTHVRLAEHVARGTIQYFVDGTSARPGVDWGEWYNAFSATWQQHVTYFGPIVKHSAFSGEREWRLLYEMKEVDEQRLQYRPSLSFISRYLELKMNHDRILPIAEAWVGPSRHKDISLVSLAHLLKAAGYGPDVWGRVQASGVPYQGS